MLETAGESYRQPVCIYHSGLNRYVTRAEAYVDFVLQDMFNDGMLIDFALDDFEINVLQVPIPMSTSVAEIKLDNWWINGLRFLKRHGKCSLSVSGNRLQIEAELDAVLIEFLCDSNIALWNYRRCFGIGGYFVNVIIYVNFDVDSKTGLDAKLLNFRIEDMKIPYVSLVGDNPLKVYLSQAIFTRIASFLKEKLRRSLENELRQKLSEVLSYYKFPRKDAW